MVTWNVRQMQIWKRRAKEVQRLKERPMQMHAYVRAETSLLQNSSIAMGQRRHMKTALLWLCFLEEDLRSVRRAFELWRPQN